ncbi:MAG: Gx transporter family protein [Firmicutes bacterium]|nr:Gx transporter family protein [Bacillota bacterium]
MRTEKLVLCSILVALSAIFSYVEAIIPIPLGIPGIKLGLANVVTVFALYRLGFGSAVIISAVRIIIVSSLFGNPAMVLYSFAGAGLSLAVMILLKCTNAFSIIGVSMAGGVFHNAGQVAMAVIVMETAGLFSYLSALIPVGMFTGVFIGIVSDKAIRHIERMPVV